MAVRLWQADRDTAIEFYAKKASTAIAFNEMVYIDTSGFVAPAINTSGAGVLGLCQKAIAATDSDYASATRIPILVPGPNAVFLGDTSGGTTPAQTDVGEYCDLVDSKNIDVAASTYDVCYVVGFMGSQVLFKFTQKSGAAAG